MVDFYQCAHCGAVLLAMPDHTKMCESAALGRLAVNTDAEGALKYAPSLSTEEGKVVVRIGQPPFAEAEDLDARWIYLKTAYGGLFCNIVTDGPPEVRLQLEAEEVEEAYAYCGKNGLWKAQEPVFANSFHLNTVACSPEFSAGCVSNSHPQPPRPMQ